MSLRDLAHGPVGGTQMVARLQAGIVQRKVRGGRVRVNGLSYSCSELLTREGYSLAVDTDGENLAVQVGDEWTPLTLACAVTAAVSEVTHA